jgi:hypothetical protein
LRPGKAKLELFRRFLLFAVNLAMINSCRAGYLMFAVAEPFDKTRGESLARYLMVQVVSRSFQPHPFRRQLCPRFSEELGPPHYPTVPSESSRWRVLGAPSKRRTFGCHVLVDLATSASSSLRILNHADLAAAVRSCSLGPTPECGAGGV